MSDECSGGDIGGGDVGGGDIGGSDIGGESVDMSMDTSVDTGTDIVDIPEDVPSELPEEVPEEIPEDTPEDLPEADIPVDEVPEDISQDIPEDVGQEVPEDISQDIPEETNPEVQEDVKEPVDGAEPALDDTSPIEETGDSSMADQADEGGEEQLPEEPVTDETTEGSEDPAAAEMPETEGQEELPPEETSAEEDESGPIEGREDQATTDVPDSEYPGDMQPDDVTEGDKNDSILDLWRVKNPQDDKSIEYWNNELPKIEKMVNDYNKENFSQFIYKDKLDRPLNETVNYADEEGMREAYGKGYETGILGFNNGNQTYVNCESGYQIPTTVHENLHQLSCNDIYNNDGNIHEYRRGISINGKDTQINEGITEYYTQKTLGSRYPDQPYSAYDHNAHRIGKMESAFGEDNIKEAYFQNKPEILRDDFDSVMGSGSWEELSRAFDDSIHENQNIRLSAQQRANNLVNSYLFRKGTYERGLIR